MSEWKSKGNKRIKYKDNMKEFNKIYNDDDLLKDLEKYFPIDLLTQEEREYAIQLNKERGWPQSVKYIKECRPDFGLKSSKIYYDLYINKR